jgi:hypothetical protein
MRLSILRITFLLLFVASMTACAHQPAYDEAAISQKVNCDSPAFSSPETRNCYRQEDHRHSEAASFFGYIIFRAVVEGLVYGLVYR